MSSITELIALYAQPDRVGDLQYHQGTIVTWDTTEHVNTVRVNNVDIPQVPFIGPDDPNIIPGVQVAILRHGTQYIILGRIREI